MSDVEETPVVQDVQEVQEVQTKMDINTALKEVLRNALISDGLHRGLRKCVKTLASGQADLCVLNEKCEDKDYIKLIEALCVQNNTKLMRVSDPKELGEWVGLCKLDKDGVARKIVGCSCAVVYNYGQPSEALHVLLEHFEN